MRIALNTDSGSRAKVARRVAMLTRLNAPIFTRCRGKPALGTSRVSRPRAVPTNAASCPRWRSSSAMASAGITWPPVPPPARTIFISICLLRDVEQHSHAGIEKRLNADHGRDANGQQAGEVVARVPRRAQSAEAEEGEGRDKTDGAEPSQLFADHGEDEVGLRLGQIKEFLCAFHQSAPEDPSRAHGDQRLNDVESRALRVGIGIDEGEHAPRSPGSAEEQKI